MNSPAGRSGTPAKGAGIYAAVLVAIVALAGIYHFRTNTIFDCQASGYGPSRYLMYCQAPGYGDYDHGAIWFDLEPEATAAASQASLLFLGNSRMMTAFSTPPALEWLRHNAPSYFLLGFAYNPRVTLTERVIGKLQPRASTYVINLDDFFDEELSEPARVVLQDRDGYDRYRNKQRWQRVHAATCGRWPVLCGHDNVMFRNTTDGSWLWPPRVLRAAPVSRSGDVRPEAIQRQVERGRKFLAMLAVPPGCVIFTAVPTVNSRIEESRAIAGELGVSFVAPQLDGLMTFDESHLDAESANRWAAAFMQAAGEQLRACAVGT